MRSKKSVLAAGIISAVAAFGMAQPASASPLLPNGDFESGDSGWSAFPLYTSVTTGAHAGIGGAKHGSHWFYMSAPTSGSFFSDPISDTAGQALTLVYWLAGNGTAGSEFKSYWNGTLLDTQSAFDSSGAWQQFVFNIADVDVLGSDVLTFAIDIPGTVFVDVMGLDRISLTPVLESVPEPSSLGLVATVLAGWSSMFRRRKGSKRGKVQQQNRIAVDS